MLKCSKCGEEKTEVEFSKRASRPRGFTSQCKLCLQTVNQESYLRSAEQNRNRAAKYRCSNPQAGSAYHAEYRNANRLRLREYFIQYAKDNPEKKRIVSASRRANKLLATPRWSNPENIAEIYKSAKQVEASCGTKMHVDHIVPLVHRLVCGLHCEANLRVLPAKKNLSKGNKYWPDMP